VTDNSATTEYGSQTGGLKYTTRVIIMRSSNWWLMSHQPGAVEQLPMKHKNCTSDHQTVYDWGTNAKTLVKRSASITSLYIVATLSCILPSHQNLQEHMPCTVVLHYQSTLCVLFHTITHTDSTAWSTCLGWLTSAQLSNSLAHIIGRRCRCCDAFNDESIDRVGCIRLTVDNS